MNLNPLKFKTNFWVILSAIVIMVLFYIFYFGYYVKTKENRVTAARFRVLDQMGKNLNKRLAVFRQNASDVKEKVNGEWQSLLTGMDEKERKDTARNVQLLIDLLNTKGDANKNLKVVRFINGKNPEKAFRELVAGSSSKDYYFPVLLNNPPFQKQINDETTLIVIKTPYSALVKGLQRGDIFDGMILIRDSSVVYNTLGQEMILVPDANKQAVKSSNNKKYAGTTQPALHIGTVVSGEVFDMSVSNISYKAFLKPVEIGNEIWYAVGLMETSHFNAVSRSIEPWIIVLLSLLLIFIILGMPFVKLKVLSKNEQLDTSTIINYALSVLLGGIFLALFISYLVTGLSRQQDVNTKLERLSETIYSGMINELASAYEQLGSYDTHFRLMTFQKNIYGSPIKINILSEGFPYFPEDYPFGDYYFWTNDKGMQTEYLTPFNTEGKLSDLSSRDYVNKKDEWFFPESTHKKFRIESIVSVSSGSVKAAVSKKGMNAGRPVVALSSKLYSVINTILPKDYSFCIIDKQGKVWFHSNENLNLNENFIAECNNNRFLKSAMYADISKSFNVSYYNQSHRIFIKPVDKLPLYLITLYNKRLEKSFFSEVITLALFFTGALVLMTFFQIIVLLIIERRFRLPLTRNILMKLTRPIMRLNGRYKYLTNLYLIVLVISLPFLVFYSDMTGLIAVFVLVIILFGYSYWMLNENETKIRQRKWFGIFNIVLLFTVTGFGIYVAGSHEWWKIVLFPAVVVLTIVAAHLFMKKEATEDNSYWMNYSRFLIVILIMMGVLPTLKFFEVAFNNESGIRTRHELLDLVKKREHRNLDLISYYNKMKPGKKRDSLFRIRKELGVYTGFNHNYKYSANRERQEITPFKGESHWDTLICYLRPFYDDYITENKYLSLDHVTSGNFNWYQNREKLLLEYNSKTEDIYLNKVIPRSISGDIHQMHFLTPFNSTGLSGWQLLIPNLIFWLLILAVVYIFYKLLQMGIHKIFNYNVLLNYFHQDFRQMLDQQLSANKDIFVVRLSPLDDTDDFIRDFRSVPGRKVIDWTVDDRVEKTPDTVEALIAQNEKEKHQALPTLLITGFEQGFERPENFNKKLQTAEQLINREDIRVVFLSKVSPDVIGQHFRKLIEDYRDNLKDGGKDPSGRMSLYLEMINRLEMFSKTFYFTSLPVRYHIPESLEKKYCHDKPKKISNKTMIGNELNASDYLRRLQPVLDDFNKTGKERYGHEVSEEQIIEKIRMLAEKYYEDLFNSCTPEEQYILMDMAHDMIMNPGNEKAIISLLKKGLLVKKCYKINLMNMSFRKFVLLKMNRAKKLELEQLIGKDIGRWQGYRVILLLIILSLFVFIAMANQDFLENLNRLFVAIGGGIAVITGILGLLSRKGKPAS